MAADIRAAVDHAEHLIGALLILARNERGLTVREEVDLATVAEDVLDTAGPGDRRVHATLEPAVISGDPVLAERLVANLVDNAVRYNVAAGDIWISTRTVAGSSQLTVANTGPVISPADADRIFQPFQRLSDRTSHDGFGLGLAIVASIAAIHGGTVTARPRMTAACPSRSRSPRPTPRPRAPASGNRTTRCSATGPYRRNRIAGAPATNPVSRLIVRSVRRRIAASARPSRGGDCAWTVKTSGVVAAERPARHPLDPGPRLRRPLIYAGEGLREVTHCEA